MISLDLDDLRTAFGLGIAGNFAGHLEQAGEHVDFEGVGPADVEAPKGIFPWYVPGDEGFLGTFPLSNDALALPAGDDPPNLQIEPEAGVAFRVTYGTGGSVESLAPFAIAAFNDCSIRRPGAPKISHKKNWGPESKGVARSVFAIDSLDPAGPTARLRLVSFLRRDYETHLYGIDSPVTGYTYYGQTLLDWIVDRLANQTGAEATPLEPVGEYLAAAGSPDTVLIGIGATRYTPFGESNYLQAGDESVVVVYDDHHLDAKAVENAVRGGRESGLAQASVLVQTVR